MTEEQINKLKSDAIMEFVNIQIGSFEAGFVEANEVSLYSLYRFAQLHVMDNYHEDIPMFSERWDADLEKELRNESEKLTIKQQGN